MKNISDDIIQGNIIARCSIMDASCIHMVSQRFKWLVEEATGFPLLKTLKPIIILFSKREFVYKVSNENRQLVQRLSSVFNYFSKNLFILSTYEDLDHAILTFDKEVQPTIERFLKKDFSYNKDSLNDVKLLNNIKSYINEEKHIITKYMNFVNESLIRIENSCLLKQRLTMLSTILSIILSIIIQGALLSVCLIIVIKFGRFNN